MRLACLFTGQGSQYYGMYEDLITRYPNAKETFDEVTQVLGEDIIQEYKEKKDLFFQNNEKSQIMLFAYEVAAFRIFQDYYEIEPCMMAGHSLGEIIAQTCAGGLSFSEALEVIRVRGRVMDECGRNKGSMMAIFDISLSELNYLCEKISNADKYVTISNINSQKQIVVSGNDSGIEDLKKYLEQMKVKTRKLNVIIPFHSQILLKAAKNIEEVLAEKYLETFKCPVISNIDVKPYYRKENLSKYLGEHIVHPVRWKETISYLINCGIDQFVELGPKPILTRMMKDDYLDETVLSVSNVDDMEKFERKIKDIRLQQLEQIISEIVCTDNHIENMDIYQKNVVEPFMELRKQRELVVIEDRLLNTNDLELFVESVKKIKKSKMVGNT